MNVMSKISPTGPPGRWAPGNFTNSLCFGISISVGVWGSLGYLPLPGMWAKSLILFTDQWSWLISMVDGGK